MRWGELTSTQIAHLGLDRYVGLVPVGAVEQHGPHLPTDTDTRVAQAICDAVAGRCDAAIVLPPIPVGCSLGHGTTFPGTLSLFPDELAGLAIRYAEWSAVSSLKRLIFVNAHMGNVASLSAATDRLRFLRPDLKCTWIDWWRVSPEVAAAVAVDGQDIHANCAETSIVLHLWPDIVDHDAMLTADDADRTSDLTFRYTAEALSRNGVTGRPSEATASLGEALFTAIVDVVVAKVLAGRDEEPPLQSPVRPNKPTQWI
jgi:creatinine amidohydrolase/Fe(II)-dependent formamide hydrolase-like protein